MINVLVLGGGITGLSAAYHLSRLLPSTLSRILLVERSPRLGGWLQSTRSGIPLEAGPRTLRPISLAIMELIHLLNLQTSLVIVPKHHPAARSRYIHFPPLTLLPPSLPSLLASHITTPALRGLLPAILREPLRKSNRPYQGSKNGREVEDESIYDLVARRFGHRFAREYLSAMVHGIYAANARSLSARAAFPFLWEAERRGQGSIIRGLVLDALFSSVHTEGPEPGGSPPYEMGDVRDQLKRAAMFTFNNGIESLSRALFNHLSECPNVDIWQGLAIKRLVPLQHGIHVETSTGKPLPFTPTHVVSAIPLPALHDIVNTPVSNSSSALPVPYLPHLDAKTNPASSVLVINLVFPPSPSHGLSSHLTTAGKCMLLHPDGFGYLVPPPPSSLNDKQKGEEKEDGYLMQDETDKRARKEMEMFGEVDLSPAILGTIFDSAICFPGEEQQEVEHDKDDDGNEEDGSNARGARRRGRATRMTIMLGGPHPLPELITSLFSPSKSAAVKAHQSTSSSLRSSSTLTAKTLGNEDEAALNLFLPPLLRTLARTLSSLQNHKSFTAPRTFDEPFELGLPPPSHVHAHYQKNCIPTYTPGHLRRMDELKAALGFTSSSSDSSSSSSADVNPWGGRMHVIGAGVGGVSVGDCVEQGRDAAFAIARFQQKRD